MSCSQRSLRLPDVTHGICDWSVMYTRQFLRGRGEARGSNKLARGASRQDNGLEDYITVCDCEYDSLIEGVISTWPSTWLECTTSLMTGSWRVNKSISFVGEMESWLITALNENDTGRSCATGQPGWYGWWKRVIRIGYSAHKREMLSVLPAPVVRLFSQLIKRHIKQVFVQLSRMQLWAVVDCVTTDLRRHCDDRKIVHSRTSYSLDNDGATRPSVRPSVCCSPLRTSRF